MSASSALIVDRAAMADDTESVGGGAARGSCLDAAVNLECLNSWPLLSSDERWDGC